MKKLLCILSVLGLLCCSEPQMDSIQTENELTLETTRTENNEVLVEILPNFGGWDMTGFYVNEIGSLYGMYSKGYLEFLDILNNMQESLIFLPYQKEGILFEMPEYLTDMCVDINNNWYCITSKNYLLKLNYTGSEPVYEHENYADLTGKFPENTVFLGLTAAHDNTNIFVSVAEGDGNDNHFKDYSTQSVYRIAANGNVVKVIENIVAPVKHYSPYSVTYTNNYSEEIPLFPYRNIISKSKGAFIYGLSANGDFFKAGTMNGEVTYYPARVEIDHLTAVTGLTNPIAVSGSQILELRPNVNNDRVICTIPDEIEGEIILFKSNADATVFYLSVKGEDAYGPNVTTYRLTLNN